jgi:hypothetical protein
MPLERWHLEEILRLIDFRIAYLRETRTPEQLTQRELDEVMEITRLMMVTEETLRSYFGPLE